MTTPPDSMTYVDREPGAWSLLQAGDELFLEARYTYGAMIDDTALICLNPTERRGYEGGGHEFITNLARRVHNSAPHQESSRFYSRNLYRGDDKEDYRRLVGGARVNRGT